MKKELMWMSIFVVIFAFLMPCAGLAQKEPIKIGVLTAMSGRHAPNGMMYVKGYQLFEEQVNQRGGILGRPVKVIYRDDKTIQTHAVTEAEKMITEDKVVAFAQGGYITNISEVVLPICEKYKIPVINVGGYGDLVMSQGYQYTFLQVMPSSYAGVTVIDFAVNELGAKTIGLAYLEDAYCVAVAEAAKEQAKKLGVKMVTFDSYDSKAVDLRPVILKAKAENPDVFFHVAVIHDAVLGVRQMAELNFCPKAIIGQVGYTIPSFLEGLGKLSNDLFTVSNWSKELKTPGNEAFVRDFVKKFNSQPSYHSALGWSAMQILEEAMTKGNTTDPIKLRDAMARVQMSTVMGPLKFTNWGKFTNVNNRPFFILQIQKGGNYAVVSPKDLATAKAVFPLPKWNEK
jgi:branched-chain amino acid transport system substrate-binding protein